jgi:hypothetical protein
MKRQFISFPKSGRTWVRYALSQAGIREPIRFHHDGFEYNDASKPALDFDFERRIARYADGGKIVYLHRDPRDVMASLYAQVTGRFSDIFAYSGSRSDFIRDPYFGARNLREFQRQWDELCSRGLALRVTYEDCHKRFDATLAEILNYFEIKFEPANIQAATEAARFERMKAVEEEGSFGKAWLQLRNNAPKVRTGRTGGYRDAFSSEDCDFLNSVFATVD